MDDDDPFPRVLKIVGRLYAEEQPGEVANPGPMLQEEIEEIPRAVEMPALEPDEEEMAPSVRLEAEPDTALDDPAISDHMKNADAYVDWKFLKDHQEKLLRPWDDVDLAAARNAPPRKKRRGALKGK
jgi:hypothetical protein